MVGQNNINTEIWATLIYNGVVYEDLQISTFGKLKKISTDKILKQSITKTGYYNVCTSLGSKKDMKTFRIHRAVACTFIPNPENKPTINHIDGNKLNNNINNLEWSTYSENIKHAFNTGLNKPLVGDKNPYSHSVDMYDLDDNLIKTFGSIEEAGRFLNKDTANIHRAYMGVRKTAYGYKWKPHKE